MASKKYNDVQTTDQMFLDRIKIIEIRINIIFKSYSIHLNRVRLYLKATASATDTWTY